MTTVSPLITVALPEPWRFPGSPFVPSSGATPKSRVPESPFWSTASVPFTAAASPAGSALPSSLLVLIRMNSSPFR